MNVTEVRIKLVTDPRDKLRGFASITLDDLLVVRDIKIIEGTTGAFVAMPSRKLCAHCPACGSKNHLRARYCNDCGVRQPERSTARDERGRLRLYADIAHPIHQEAREFLERVVLEEFRAELDRSRQEGWVAQRFDDLDYDAWSGPDAEIAAG